MKINSASALMISLAIMALSAPARADLSYGGVGGVSIGGGFKIGAVGGIRMDDEDRCDAQCQHQRALKKSKAQLDYELVGKKLTSMIAEQMRNRNVQLEFQSLQPEEDDLKSLGYFLTLKEPFFLRFSIKKGNESFRFKCPLTARYTSDVVTQKSDCDVMRSSTKKLLSKSEINREGLGFDGFDFITTPLDAQAAAMFKSAAVSKIQAKKQNEGAPAQVQRAVAESAVSGVAAH